MRSAEFRQPHPGALNRSRHRDRTRTTTFGALAARWRPRVSRTSVPSRNARPSGPQCGQDFCHHHRIVDDVWHRASVARVSGQPGPAPTMPLGQAIQSSLRHHGTSGTFAARGRRPVFPSCPAGTTTKSEPSGRCRRPSPCPRQLALDRPFAPDSGHEGVGGLPPRQGLGGLTLLSHFHGQIEARAPVAGDLLLPAWARILRGHLSRWADLLGAFACAARTACVPCTRTGQILLHQRQMDSRGAPNLGSNARSFTR